MVKYLAHDERATRVLWDKVLEVKQHIQHGTSKVSTGSTAGHQCQGSLPSDCSSVCHFLQSQELFSVFLANILREITITNHIKGMGYHVKCLIGTYKLQT